MAAKLANRTDQRNAWRKVDGKTGENTEADNSTTAGGRGRNFVCRWDGVHSDCLWFGRESPLGAKSGFSNLSAVDDDSLQSRRCGHARFLPGTHCPMFSGSRSN